MARLCAPVRDETVRGLMKESDVLTVFRGVMETLDLMRLDMANFTIQQIRPHIVAQVQMRIITVDILCYMESAESSDGYNTERLRAIIMD